MFYSKNTRVFNLQHVLSESKRFLKSESGTERSTKPESGSERAQLPRPLHSNVRKIVENIMFWIQNSVNVYAGHFGNTMVYLDVMKGVDAKRINIGMIRNGLTSVCTNSRSDSRTLIYDALVHVKDEILRL